MSALAMTGTMLTTLLRRFMNSMSRGLRLEQRDVAEGVAGGTWEVGGRNEGQKKEKGSWDTLSPGSRGWRGRPAPSTLVHELPKPPVGPLGEVLPLPPAQVAIVPWVLDTGERKEVRELTRPQLPGRAGRLLSGAVPAPPPTGSSAPEI